MECLEFSVISRECPEKFDPRFFRTPGRVCRIVGVILTGVVSLDLHLTVAVRRA
jgi:hypothetical protein